MQAITVKAFQAYGIPLNLVTFFNCLGRIMTALDDDWLAVVGNMWKLRKSRAQLSRILGREGANPRMSGIFFKVVVQALLIFESDTWVMTPLMGRSLQGVQHRVAKYITGRQPWRIQDRSWD